MKPYLYKAFLSICCTWLFVAALVGQQNFLPVQDLIHHHRAALDQTPEITLLTPDSDQGLTNRGIAAEVSEGLILQPQLPAQRLILREAPDVLVLNLPVTERTGLVLELVKVDIFSEDFNLYAATDRDIPLELNPGVFYRGIVQGQSQSKAALSVHQGEIMALIIAAEGEFTLGKLSGSDNTHILYNHIDLLIDFDFSCGVDPKEHQVGDSQPEDRSGGDPSNCVRLYVEVDYDIFVGKGGMTQTVNYITGAFNQVFVLYANENISMVLHELIVWNVTDPYTGPSTSNYLSQFRNNVGSNFNGDLAHLVGYGGGGGVAYLDVLCNKSFAFGYSAVNSTYNIVPTYSWTVMVLAHEIGHNLGPRHTHDCVWNGNNTPIDCCGTNAGYNGSFCSGYNCTIQDPPSGGTVMSYCHLRSVGINFNNGFGPQPGDLMRNRVYNAACLSSCGPSIVDDAGISAIFQPAGKPCENTTVPEVELSNFGSNAITSVIIKYQLNNGPVSQYNWTGNLAANGSTLVYLPQITYSPGQYTFKAWTEQPNGETDPRPSNDESITSFEYIEGYCDCNEATASFPFNPLTHSGSGSSSTLLNLGDGSKHAAFMITGLAAQTSGNPNNRYVDRATVTYADGNGTVHTYGVFNGNQQSSASVYIDGFVQWISVALSNGLSSSYSGTLSVSLSEVEYCGGETDCPGFDESLIGTPCDDGDPCTYNDIWTADCICEGTLDPACGDGDCPNVTDVFSPNPLTHTGSGSSSSMVQLPAGSSEVEFTISNMSARLNGPPNNRYNDQVTVTYLNGSGQVVTYGTFLGSQQSSVAVSISDQVQSVTVSLADGNSGNAGNNVLSVSMSVVEACQAAEAPMAPGNLNAGAVNGALLYPNPTSGIFTLQLDHLVEYAEVIVYNQIGVKLSRYELYNQQTGEIDLSHLQLGHQLLFITVQIPDQPAVVRHLMITSE